MKTVLLICGMSLLAACQTPSPPYDDPERVCENPRSPSEKEACEAVDIDNAAGRTVNDVRGHYDEYDQLLPREICLPSGGQVCKDLPGRNH